MRRKQFFRQILFSKKTPQIRKKWIIIKMIFLRSKSYTGDEKWGEPVGEKLEKVANLAFEQELDEDIIKRFLP